MPCVILKTNGGMDFPIAQKTISLNGFCVLNDVSDEDLKSLKTFEPFNEMVKNGYIEIASKAGVKDANKIANEVAKEQSEKQDSKTRNIKREV